MRNSTSKAPVPEQRKSRAGTVRLPADIYDAIKAQAKRNRRMIGAEVSLAIEAYLGLTNGNTAT